MTKKISRTVKKHENKKVHKVSENKRLKLKIDTLENEISKLRTSLKESKVEVTKLTKEVHRLLREKSWHESSYGEMTAELANCLVENQRDAARILGCDKARYAINLLKIYQSKYATADNPFRKANRPNE